MLWISLYYINQTHFQVLVLEKLGEQRCFFMPADLPEELRALVEMQAWAACTQCGGGDTLREAVKGRVSLCLLGWMGWPFRGLVSKTNTPRYLFVYTVSTRLFSNSCPSFAATGESAAGLLRDTGCLCCRRGAYVFRLLLSVWTTESINLWNTSLLWHKTLLWRSYYRAFGACNKHVLLSFGCDPLRQARWRCLPSSRWLRESSIRAKKMSLLLSVNLFSLYISFFDMSSTLHKVTAFGFVGSIRFLWKSLDFCYSSHCFATFMYFFG